MAVLRSAGAGAGCEFAGLAVVFTGGGSVKGPRVPQAPSAIESSRTDSVSVRRMKDSSEMKKGSTGWMIANSTAWPIER